MNIFRLLPPYLSILAVVLVIIPTFLGIIARFFLYQHLTNSVKKIRSLLEGRAIEKKPSVIKKIEQRFQSFNPNTSEVNTDTIISVIYSQERCRVLGLPFNCDAVAYFTRLLPNLLLSFGLLGTFLGITINLTNLSQTITQVDITQVGELLTALNKPLQGMGIAFITSLIAIACSSFLTVLNLIWNTNIAKNTLINFLEDYIDRVCIPQLQIINPLELTIERFNDSCDRMLTNLGDSIETAISNAFRRVEKSADTFQEAANTLENSRLPEQLANATSDLAIAQNNFSQSSLVLQRSTQSFEHSLEAINKLMRHLATLKQDVNQIHSQQNSLQAIEQAELRNIQQQIEQLIQVSRNGRN